MDLIYLNILAKIELTIGLNIKSLSDIYLCINLLQ